METNTAADVDLDTMMEQASVALSRMDYLACEGSCLDALAAARQCEDWAYYRRILLPLQECRRQRRMIAAEGMVRLGTSTLSGPIEMVLSDITQGCIVVSRPNTPEQAMKLIDITRQQHHYIEVLFADNPSDSDEPHDDTKPWRLIALGSLSFGIERPAPPQGWRESWRPGGDKHDSNVPHSVQGSATIADWFIDASEKLGDAAIQIASAETQPRARLSQLEKCLQSVTDHEKLHQRLWETATQLSH